MSPSLRRPDFGAGFAAPHKGTSMSQPPTTTFPGVAPSVPAARHFVADLLAAAGCDDEVIFDASIAVTELASNSVRHAHSPFTVTLIIDAFSVVVEVHDESVTLPVLREADSSSGRGLHLIAAVAENWGARLAPNGKVVFARVVS
jgi:anti-sigma regulatory factor (Ser/Thr protein kinase)